MSAAILIPFKPDYTENILEIYASCFPWRGIQPMRNVVADKTYTVTLACRENSAEHQEITGFIIWRITCDEIEVIDLCSAVHARRSGAAKMLLSDCLATARMFNIPKVFLEVSEQNIPALNLYKQFNFREYARREGYYKSNPPENALLMRTLVYSQITG